MFVVLQLFAWPGPVDPKGADAPEPPATLYQLVLLKLSRTLCVTPALGNESCGSLCQPVGAGAGFGTLCVAAEANALLRALLQVCRTLF